MTYCDACPVTPGLLCRSGIPGDRNPHICGDVPKYRALLARWSLDPEGVKEMQVFTAVEACRNTMTIIEPETLDCRCGEKRWCSIYERLVARPDCVECKSA
jgi:hypothetical protein